MTRLLSSSEYKLLRQHGFSSDAVSKYGRGYTIPWPKRQREIIAILGRDPWGGRTATSAVRPRKPVPVAPPPIVNDPPVNCQTNVKHCQIDVPHLMVNACADDDVCLAVRGAAMRRVANTLEDQRKPILCTSCKPGIARAKVAAAKRLRDQRYSRRCPECDGAKNPGSLTCPKCKGKEGEA